MARTMIALILIGIALLLLAWLSRRHARRQIGQCLSGRILYTDTEANREILTSDRYNLSGKPDYILEENGEFIPVDRKSRNVNERGAHDSERLQLAAYCLLVEERYAKPVRRGRLQYRNASIDIPFDAALRAALLSSLREIQQRRTIEDVRRSHHSPARCRGCGGNRADDTVRDDAPSSAIGAPSSADPSKSFYAPVVRARHGCVA
jgi:CRISPR-associated exonuclease Cas4